MKRLIFAIMFIILAVGLSVFGHWDLKKTGNDLIVKLQESAEFTKNKSPEKARESAEAGLELWKKNKTRFEIYLNHDELDNIQIYFKEIEKGLNGQDEFDIAKASLDCVNELEHVIESDAPRIGEIL